MINSDVKRIYHFYLIIRSLGYVSLMSTFLIINLNQFNANVQPVGTDNPSFCNNDDPRDVVDGIDIYPKMRSVQEQVTDDQMKDIRKEEQENVEQCVLRKIMLLPKKD